MTDEYKISFSVSQLLRHSGTQALRHSETQALRHSETQKDFLKIIID